MIEIRPVPATRSALKKYIHFGMSLYKDNPYYVPPLVIDMINTMDPKKNPAFDHCRAQRFMAFKDGMPAGVITAIINDKHNLQTGEKQARFGFVEFIDDPQVVDALFNAAENWAREQGMTEIIGPLGFSDMDPEGMLIEGFEELGTMATIYNHPYYPEHMQRLGYEKDADWVEYVIDVPDEIPEKMRRISELVLKRYKLKLKKYTSRKKIKADYGQALFDCINEAYANLYGYCQLTKKQIDYYVDMYLQILPLDFVTLVTDENDQLVALGVTIPSLSRALQRSHGKLLPLGWKHLINALKGKNDRVDLLLIAVKPEYQARGVNALMFYDLIPVFNKHHIKQAESNVELENNANVQQQWDYFTHRQHRRRRAFKKQL